MHTKKQLKLRTNVAQHQPYAVTGKQSLTNELKCRKLTIKTILIV